MTTRERKGLRVIPAFLRPIAKTITQKKSWCYVHRQRAYEHTNFWNRM